MYQNRRRADQVRRTLGGCSAELLAASPCALGRRSVPYKSVHARAAPAAPRAVTNTRGALWLAPSRLILDAADGV